MYVVRESKMSISLLSFLIIFASFSGEAYARGSLTRSSFPNGFIFGAGSSSYQIEGAYNEGGKGLSNWDYDTHQDPSIILDGSNGDVADDFYHRYKEDVKLMKDMGLDYFRFSISWARILPNGNKAGGINQRGIDFYNNLINELLANGIKPFVTLCHWDVPHALEQKYGGPLSPKIAEDFLDLADICFKEFGDRVKDWTTLNEPNINARLGYSQGLFVPNRCTRTNTSFPCVAGNSATEPYLVGHNLLLAHVAAFNLYKYKYQGIQEGKIGITVACDWVEPYDNQPSSKEAAERLYEQTCGWFYNPVTYGDYPKSMRLLVGKRLPKFTKKQSRMLKRSFDFLGLNTYSASYAYEQRPTMLSCEQDAHAASTFVNKRNLTLGKPTPKARIFDYPEGIEKLVMLLKRNYGNPTIIVTENGYGTQDEVNKVRPVEEYIKDGPRIDYLQGHLISVLRGIKRGADVKGYFIWSFMDVFEWRSGYLDKYGLIYVDRKNNLKRIMKDSGKWYKNLLHSRRS